MVVQLLSRYVDNHGHLWSRDFKLTNKCVYSLIPLFLLKLSAREYLAPGSTREYLALGSTREYLDQVGNKGSHLTYFFYPQTHIPTMAKIKGFKRNKRNTHARQIRMLKQRLSHTKGAYKLQQMSQHGKIK